MKTRGLAFFFLLISGLLCARNVRVDSLRTALRQADDPKTKADIYNHLSRAALHIHPDSALSFARKAFNISRKSGHTLGQAEARLNQANAQIEAGHLEGANKSLQMATRDFEQLADGSGLGKCLLSEARIDLARHSFNAALLHCHQADSTFRVAADSAGIAELLRVRGLVFERLGSYDLALEDFRAALGLLKRMGDTDGQAFVLDRVGDVEEELGNFATAAERHRSALQIHGAQEDFFGKMESHLKLARLQLRLGQGIQARTNADRALRIAMQLQAEQGLARSHQMIAQVELENQRPDSALKYFRLARKYWNTTELLDRQSESRLGIAKAHFARRDYGPAIQEAETAVQLADSAGELETMAAGYQLSSKSWERAGDFRRALRNDQYEVAVLDSLRKIEQKNRVIELQVRLEHEQAVAQLRLEKALADKELERKDSLLIREEYMLYAAIGVGVLLLVFLIFLIRNSRRVRKSNRLLQQRSGELEDAREEVVRMNNVLESANQNLEQQVASRTKALKAAVDSLTLVNEELDNFVYRASHDLLGPIARLKGLVLVAKSSDPSPETQKYIDLIDSVSYYMDRVLRKLILIQDLKNTNATPEEIQPEDLVYEITPSLNEIPGIRNPEIVMNNHLEDPIHVARAPLKIILENLLENACVFRRNPFEKNPRIYLSVLQEQNDIVLELWDEGIGIPDELQTRVFDIFFRGSERSKGSGLGLHLVKQAVDLLGGRIDLESKEGVFTKVMVRFPAG
ncbi:MAG: ATP-binding protein [Bacteroidota bacterium]